MRSVYLWVNKFAVVNLLHEACSMLQVFKYMGSVYMGVNKLVALNLYQVPTNCSMQVYRAYRCDF